MKMYIHSSYGVLDCEPMTLQNIENSVKEGELQAKENVNSSVTAADQEETEAASDSC